MSKPIQCPFCKGVDLVFSKAMADTNWGCRTCLACGPNEELGYSWNHRPREEALADRVETLTELLEEAREGLQNGLELWSDCDNAKATIAKIDKTLNPESEA